MGEDERKKRSDQATAYSAEKLKAATPGLNLRDVALSNGIYQAPISYMGLQTSKTPTQLGVPKWDGSPEENAKMMRAAARFYGMGTVGFAEIDQRVKDKLIRKYDKAAEHKEYVFEDVTVGYEEKTKLVLPGKTELYDMAFTHPLSKEMYRTWPSLQHRRRRQLHPLQPVVDHPTASTAVRPYPGLPDLWLHHTGLRRYPDHRHQHPDRPSRGRA